MSRRPQAIDESLVAWVQQNLKGPPRNENYYKMISGVPYSAMEPGITRDRLISSERTADYYALRTRDFDAIEEFETAREEFIHSIFGSVGEGAFVEPPFYVDYGYNIKVGKNFYANFGATFLDCSIIRIGNCVMLGPNVSIITAEHPLEAGPRTEGVELARPVTIGNNVWIGSNAVILPGVTIGDNAVIAAGAVVSRDVGESMLVGGVPARPMKKIVNEELENEKLSDKDGGAEQAND